MQSEHDSPEQGTSPASMPPSPIARLWGARFFDRLGALPDEPESERIARRTLLLGGILMSGGGVLWGVLSLVFGRYVASIIPFGYIALTGLNFLVFARTRSFRRARFVQVFISLALPFLFQWSLGGFLASGAVMLWAMVSIVGALTFSEARESGLWLVLYCVLTIVSGVIDPRLADSVAFSTAGPVRIGFLVLNLVVVSVVVFGLAIFLNAIRARAVASLERANADNSSLNDMLSAEVEARGMQVNELRELRDELHAQAQTLSSSLEQLKRTQQELVRREKLAALGQLVAGVAHEVNTPLGVVYTAVTLGLERLDVFEGQLASGSLTRRQALDAAAACREALEIASSNAQRAAKLIADFKRVAVDQTSESVQSIELRAYLDTLVQSLSPMLSRAGASVEVEGEPVHVVTRPGSIAQVVTNLIQNAVLHAYPDPSSERRIGVRCRVEPGGERVVVEVEDWGCGMSPEVQARVFEPFFTTKRGEGGSGLGMHIAHQQVYEALGGTLLLHSAPGRGTRVELAVPRSAALGRGGSSEASVAANVVKGGSDGGELLGEGVLSS